MNDKMNGKMNGDGRGAAVVAEYRNVKMRAVWMGWRATVCRTVRRATAAVRGEEGGVLPRTGKDVLRTLAGFGVEIAILAALVLFAGPVGGGTAAAAAAGTTGTTATSAAAVQPDAIITEWAVGPGGVGYFIAKDTHDTLTATIPATFDPAAVKGVPNLTQPDNVQALVAAMGAKDWGAAIVGSEVLVFSPELLAKFQTAGVNVGWVYQRLYTHMDPGAPPPPIVPKTPQTVYVSGKGPTAQPPQPTPKEPTPVVTQNPKMGTATETATKTTQTKTATSTGSKTKTGTATTTTPLTAAQKLTEAKKRKAQDGVVKVKPAPGAASILVPGAYTAPGWIQAQKALQRVRAAQMRTRDEEWGAGFLAAIGLFFLSRWLFFRRRVA